MREQNKIYENEDQELLPVLFGPRDGKHLKSMYKELSEDPVFKELSNAEFLFSWLIGIPYSPVPDHLNQDIRYKMAAERAFPLGKDTVTKERFAMGDLSDGVKQAIQKFRDFSPEARMIAQSATQEMIYNLRNLAIGDPDLFVYWKECKDADGNKFNVKETDWDARNKYISSCKTISETLPILIKKLEDGGYGINDKKSDKKEYGKKPIDKFHANERDKVTK